MATRCEEARIAQRNAQHRQLQPGDLARHLRRHPRIGEDLVEQAAHHLDQHVIELSFRRLRQLLAVRAYEVGGHQAVGQAQALGSRRLPDRWHAGAMRGACEPGAARPAGIAAHRFAVVQAPEQAHQVGIGLDRFDAARCRRQAREVPRQRAGTGVGASAPESRRSRRPRHVRRQAAPHQPVEQRRGAFRSRLARQRFDLAGPANHRFFPVPELLGGIGADQRLALQRPLPALVHLLGGDERARPQSGRHVGRANREIRLAHPLCTEVFGDGPVAAHQPSCERLADLLGQNLLRRRIVADLLDRRMHGRADDVAAQRVALGVGPAVLQQTAGVAGELAQLDVALVADELADALERQPVLDLRVADEADRIPVGLLTLQRGGTLGPGSLVHLLAQRRGEGLAKRLLMLQQMRLRPVEPIAIGVGRRRLGRLEQVVHGLTHRDRRRGADEIARLVESSRHGGLALSRRCQHLYRSMSCRSMSCRPRVADSGRITPLVSASIFAGRKVPARSCLADFTLAAALADRQPAAERGRRGKRVGYSLAAPVSPPFSGRGLSRNRTLNPRARHPDARATKARASPAGCRPPRCGWPQAPSPACGS